MVEEMRKTGIDIIGDASWGTHFCQFYQTREDLIDILVPYFQAGLEENEFCMWVTSEPLEAEDAKISLEKAVRNLGSYIKKGQIEILDASQWYIKSGKFEPDKVLQGWAAKENQALKRGFDGLRVSGNTFWLEKRDWRNFADYEAVVNNVIGKYRMIAICPYSLDKYGPSEVIDVASNHQFALIKREGKWELIESSERKQAEQSLRIYHHFLRILNRHSEMIPMLKEYVTEVRKFTGCAVVGLRILDDEGNIPYEAYEGFSRRFYESESPLSIRSDQCMCVNVIKGVTNPQLPFYTEGGSFCVNATTRFLATVSEEEKGRTRNICNEFGYESVALIPIRLGDQILGLIHVADHQENMVPLEMVQMLEKEAFQLGIAFKRFRAEKQLKSSRDQLRNLSAHLETVREQERSRISREIQHELGQTLLALKMELSLLGDRLPKDHKSLLEKTKSMTKLVDMTVQRVQRISAELRPALLDHLGLTAAIEWQTKEFHNRTGVKCEVALDPENIILDKDCSTAIFRIFQETLANVARHANATKVEVSLREKAGRVVLRVRDNGKGITKKQISDPQSLGLIGIQEHAHHWGGEVKIIGIRDKGTTVTVSISLDKKRETQS